MIQNKGRKPVTIQPDAAKRQQKLGSIRKLIGLLILTSGISVILPSVVGGAGFGNFIAGGMLILLGISMLSNSPKKERAAKSRPTSSALKKEQNADAMDSIRAVAKRMTAVPEPEENQHNHIKSTALNTDRRLEQLKTLRDAGLYTEEEYLEERRKILGK